MGFDASWWAVHVVRMNGYLPAAMIEIKNLAIVAAAYWLGERQFTLCCMPPQVAVLAQFSDLNQCS